VDFSFAGGCARAGVGGVTRDCGRSIPDSSPRTLSRSTGKGSGGQSPLYGSTGRRSKKWIATDRRYSHSSKVCEFVTASLTGFDNIEPSKSSRKLLSLFHCLRCIMKYAELVQVYFERSNALQWYWTVYVVVIGGLLAFSSIRQRPDLVTGVLVTVLFAFFAYKNLGAIRDVTMQRVAVASLIRQSSPAAATSGAIAGTEVADMNRLRQVLEPTLITPAYEGIRNFHIASDLLTIAAFWAMEWRRRKAAKAPGRGV
jgi:hypothetical protein